MSDSDEPLSILKEKMPCTSQSLPVDLSAPKKKIHKRKKKVKKKSGKPTFEDTSQIRYHPPQPPVLQPHDVWLYMKDFNLTGPYSCLLCPEWFISKPKIIIHYILNHKKDYCGICRYFVDNREMWHQHTKVHIPIPCSRCSEMFDDNTKLRNHFSETHNSIHCRFCGSLLTKDTYNDHLFSRHAVANVANKENPDVWQIECNETPKFSCSLCVESIKPSVDFYTHYICFHKFSIKSFAAHLSGTDVPFVVYGANVTTSFIEFELKNHAKVGYADPEKAYVQNSLQESMESNLTLLQALIPEIKQEIVSDSEERVEGNPITVVVEQLNEDEVDKLEGKADEDPDPILNYKGKEDFDVTLTEVILINKSYIDYLNLITKSYELKIVPTESKIPYDKPTDEEIICDICVNPYPNVKSLRKHMVKMHSVKILPTYLCRLCMGMYETEAEYRTHSTAEINDFQDLWICQFCDEEFDGRESTRKHLTDHWSELKTDNCFSPHLGYKCRYCPTLFWNEIDREYHQIRVHFDKHKEEFYKCTECENIYSDKIWFLYHYYVAHPNLLPDHYMMKCVLCSTVFATVEQTKQHFIKEHPEAKKIYCSLGTCKFKPFSRSKSFKMHIQTFHGRDPKPQEDVQCVVCGKMFENARACSSHASLAHVAGRYKCGLCQATLQTMDERKLHQLLQHPEHKPWVCKICGRGFKHKSGMYMHKAEHRAPTQFTCSHCGKTFPKKESLREHMLIHEGPRHSCSYCPMTFVQRSNMLRHERRHTGEKPYSCTHCGRGFSDRGAANCHMRTHVPSESFPCPYCGQRFVQRAKLVFHMRRHTGKDLETCHLCSKLFTSVYALRSHLKTHDKGPRHKCNICGKDFGQPYYLERHINNTHSVQTLKCPLCDFTVSNMSNMRGHVLTHSTVKHIQCCLCPKAYTTKKSIIQHLIKNHDLKGGSESMKHLYTTLDPWKCGLNLDSQTIENIFGKKLRHNYDTDVVVGDYFTIKDVPIEMQSDENVDNAENSNERIEENDIESEIAASKKAKKRKKKQLRKEKKKNKKERVSESEGEEYTQPTDLVLVKLEPMDSE